MKKRMAALLGALTLGLGLLAGCTNTAGAGASAGGSGLPNAANGTLDPNDPITITFYSYNLSNPSQAETMQAIIDGFNETVGKEKGIIVEGVADEVTGNLTKTKADIQAGNQVNIIQHTFPTLDSSRLNLGIQAYEDIFPADEMEEHFAGIDGGARQLGVIDGKTYGIAFTFSTPVMYINADLLREAGLDPETDAPKTWDEMLTVCRTIKETTGKYGLCLPATATNSWITESLIFSNGGTMLSEDRTEATFASEETVEAFTVWKQLYDEGLCAPGTETEAAQQFFTENAAMYLSSTAVQSSIQQAADAAGWELTGAAEPAFGDKETAPTNSGSCLAVRASSDDEAAACWEFIQYATSAESYTMITTGIGYLPLRSDIVDDPAYLKDYADANPLLRVNMTQLEKIHPSTIWPGNEANEINTIFCDAVTKAITTDADILETLQEAQDQINALIGQ